MEFQAIGFRGNASFDDIISHFRSLGGDAVLFNPAKVLGKDHLISAAQHAERSFLNGTNRSKSLTTEIILYAAWERQISKAISKMRPIEGDYEYVALLMDVPDPNLDSLRLERDDSIMDATEAKAEALGLSKGALSFEDQALENVAMVDLLKV